jgi:hypothetical protein
MKLYKMGKLNNIQNMTQELQQKIYDGFLQRFEAFRNSGYIINIYSSKDIKNIYVIEISEQYVYSYSFGAGEHHMVDKVAVLGNFYARAYDNGEIEYFVDT